LKSIIAYLWVICLSGANALFGQVTHSVLAAEGSGEPINGNEPSIALDPISPNRAVVGVNTSTVMRTMDPALRNWSSVIVSPPQGFYGDPVIKFTDHGVVYLAHLAKNKEGKWPSFFDRIVFERSDDAGVTFTSTDIGYHLGKMQDKPWFSMDEWKKSKGYGNVYLTWTEFDSYHSSNPQDSSRIWFARSVDGGRSFQTPVVISDRGGDAMDDDATAEGANVTVSPDGSLHAVWSRNDTIWYDCSTDFGKTWGKDQFVAEQFGGWNHENVKGTMRVNGMPFIESNAKGHLFVVYSGGACNKQTMGACKSRDVYLVCKFGAKGSFTVPATVNRPERGMDDATHRLDVNTPDFEMTEQYSPALVTSANKKRVFVAWQDRRRSVTGGFFDVYGAELVVEPWYRGKAGNLTWLKRCDNIRLSKTASVAPGDVVFMGDYIGLDWQKDIVLAYTGFDASRLYPVIQLAKVGVKPRLMGLRKINGVNGVLEPGLTLWVPENVQEKSHTRSTVEKGRSDEKILIWAEWPEVNNFTIEIKMGSQVVFSHVFENLLDSKVDFELPLSRFVPGPYEIVLRKKGRSVSFPINLK
jgi:hypothetical protein